jgi:hypothetical protein
MRLRRSAVWRREGLRGKARGGSGYALRSRQKSERGVHNCEPEGSGRNSELSNWHCRCYCHCRRRRRWQRQRSRPMPHGGTQRKYVEAKALLSPPPSCCRTAAGAGYCHCRCRRRSWRSCDRSCRSSHCHSQDESCEALPANVANAALAPRHRKPLVVHVFRRAVLLVCVPRCSPVIVVSSFWILAFSSSSRRMLRFTSSRFERRSCVGAVRGCSDGRRARR